MAVARSGLQSETVRNRKDDRVFTCVVLKAAVG